MVAQVETSTQDDLGSIIELMCEAFRVNTDEYFVNRSLLHWKYFLQHDDTNLLPKSFLLRRKGVPVAHCGVTTLTLAIPRNGNSGPTIDNVTAVAFMDWVGARQMPGAGIVLKKRLMDLAEVAIVAGGSEATRIALPKLGFEIRQTLACFARVVRPFRQARERPRTGFVKDALRLFRNTAWSVAPCGTVPSGWKAVRVDAFTELPPVVTHLGTVSEHPAEYLNYWMRCPIVKTAGFEIEREGARSGYFFLASHGGQTRVADIRLNSRSLEDWQTAYRLAWQTACDDPNTCEVMCVASTPGARRALTRNGFRERSRLPLFVYDPHEKLKGAPPLFWNLIDNDLAYIYDPPSPYIT